MSVEGKKLIQLTLDNKKKELELFEKSQESFYLEVDQAKEKMLVMASIIRVNRKKLMIMLWPLQPIRMMISQLTLKNLEMKSMKCI